MEDKVTKELRISILWGLNFELWTLWYEPLMTTNYANYANAYCNVIRVIRVIRSLKS